MNSFPPPVGQPAPPVESTPPTPSRRRLGAWLAGGAVVVALIVGAVFLFGGDGDKDKESAKSTPGTAVEGRSTDDTAGKTAEGKSADSKDAFSLNLVAKTAAETKAINVVATIDVGGQKLPLETTIDMENQVMHATFDMSAMVPGTKSGEIIVDRASETMYMSTAILPAGETSGLPAGVEYLKFNLAQLDELGGGSVGFDQMFNKSNPLDVAPLLSASSDATVVGDETLDGEAVRHYKVRVPTEDLIKQDPSLQQAADSAGEMLPEAFEYDVWVTADNQLRRLVSDMEIGGQSFKIDSVSRALDQAPDIKIPSDSQTVDLNELMGATTEG